MQSLQNIKKFPQNIALNVICFLLKHYTGCLAIDEGTQIIISLKQTSGC